MANLLDFMNSIQKKNKTGSMNPDWQEGMQGRAVEFTQPSEGGQPFDLFNQVAQIDEMEIFPEQTQSYGAANLQMGGAPSESTGISDFDTGDGLSTMDKVHLGLAAVGIGSTGWAEPVGFLADVTDAALYALEGDLWGAGLSGLAAIPYYGTKLNVMKLNKMHKKLKDSKDFAKAAKLENTIEAMKNPVVANELSIRMEDKWVREAFKQGKALFNAGDIKGANAAFNKMERLSPGIKDGFLSYAEFQAKITRNLGETINPKQMESIFYGTDVNMGKIIDKVAPSDIDRIVKEASKPTFRSIEEVAPATATSRTRPSGRPGGSTFANLMRLMKSEDEIKKINMPNRMPNIENMGY